MKRIVVLIDGTWDKEGTAQDTNVAKLHGANPFIEVRAADGTVQRVHYHDGVGAEGDLVQRSLGLIFGWGLKNIIRDAYNYIVADYESGDEVYIIGFSRGAYAARALAGLIGASGIQRQTDSQVFEVAWRHYRVKPAARQQPQSASRSDRSAVANYRSLASQQAFHTSHSVKCVAVWDTVGSYGIPAGFGLTVLARYIALMRLGFHDTSFGEHVEVGLHAIAVDEHRRPFVPTFWTISKGQQPKGHVEQTWFAGCHENIGGGYADSGLSDQALIWMIARVQALTGLEFNVQAVRANTQPNILGTIFDSTRGIWVIDHFWPHYRIVLSPVAIHHGYLFNSTRAGEEHINERIHWSVLAKRDGNAIVYDPRNLPKTVPTDKVATITDEEGELLRGTE